MIQQRLFGWVNRVAVIVRNQQPQRFYIFPLDRPGRLGESVFYLLFVGLDKIINSKRR